MTTLSPLEETITFPMQQALYELQRTEPKEVNLPPRPYNIMRELTPANQGRQCLSEYFRAKRFKLKKEMILYLYYLGEVIEKLATAYRKEYEPHKEYLSYHYWKMAIKFVYVISYYWAKINLSNLEKLYRNNYRKYDYRRTRCH